MSENVINLTRERIRREMEKTIKGELEIIWDWQFHASIKKLFVRPHGKNEFEEWVCYCDSDDDESDFWGPWDLFSLDRDE